MKIAIGSDHAGFVLKEKVKVFLKGAGHQPLDVGTKNEESVDYPDFAHKVARTIQRGDALRGILICGTGIGMSMCANRHAGVRAAQVYNRETAEMSRRHNNSNVLCMGARLLSEETALELAGLWLETPFDGGRHDRRVKKIDETD